MYAYICIIAYLLCIFLKYAKYANICKICGKFKICSSAGPVPGYSGTIPASSTITGSCKLFIACKCIRIRPIRVTLGPSHACCYLWDSE